MSILSMTTDEVRRRFGEGATIQILAELNDTSPSVIRAIVHDLIPKEPPKIGPLPPAEKKPEPHQDRKQGGRIEDTKAREMYDRGCSDAEIAGYFDVSAQSVYGWRRRCGLPSNFKGGRPKRKPAVENKDFADAVQPMFDEFEKDKAARADPQLTVAPEFEAAAREMDVKAETLILQKAHEAINPVKEAKHDQGKPRLSLVPPALIEAVGRVRTYGTEKYGSPDNWRTVEPWRYKDALMRHLCEYLRDPDSVDEESGIPHLEHMACNVAFLLEFREGGHE